MILLEKRVNFLSSIFIAQTGEIHYIDWSMCKKGKNDPRELLGLS